MPAAGIEFTITVDGDKVTCGPGKTVLEAATECGIHIPTLCYNPLFGEHRTGACRICLVEVVAGGRPGLEPSCTLPASPGLSVMTRSEKVYLARRSVVELILSEHVQDCRDCASSGECTLARLCKEYDMDGVPVCAECPNQGAACLLQRGELCMGPLTHSGCDAYCTRKGYPCEGCCAVTGNEDVLRFGLKSFMEAGFGRREILEGAEVFSREKAALLDRLMTEEGFE